MSTPLLPPSHSHLRSPLKVFLPTGTVYGVLLNFRAEAEAMAPQMGQAPYKAPPQEPVLYVKTANTWSPNGVDIPVPARVAEVEIGASIAMVMGQDLHKGHTQDALNAVAGYVLVNDLSVPHTSFFRPPVKFKCLDGFLGLGDTLRSASPAPDSPHISPLDPSLFVLEVRVNGEVRQTVQFAHLVRHAAQLLADVSAFMTLRAGDVLLLGCDAGRPHARVGDSITLSAPGFATLTNTLIAETA